MERPRHKLKPDSRIVAAAAVVAMIAVEVETASKLTLDAMRTSTAIAVRVVSPPGHVKATVGVSLALATTALFLILLSRISNSAAMLTPPLTALVQRATRPPNAWRCRLIRAARAGGARDR
jgi:hypothetical protein